MSADLWASYVSGALGIIIGNRLDIWKTELQAGNRHFVSTQLLDHAEPSRFRTLTSLLRGAAAPVLTYGALNSVLFMTYNRSLKSLDPSIFDYNQLAGVDLGKIWVAGAIGGLTCWIVSAPTEMVKCRTQLMIDGQKSSYATTIDIWKRTGVRGFYVGGTLTSLRDSIGYAWYFWTYELSKRLLLSRQADPFLAPGATDILIAGGIAGVVTWSCIYPLDVIKTRLQTQSTQAVERGALLTPLSSEATPRKTSWIVARNILQTEGFAGFFKGLGVCNVRAFLVNAIQFFIYDKMMNLARVPA